MKKQIGIKEEIYSEGKEKTRKMVPLCASFLDSFLYVT